MRVLAFSIAFLCAAARGAVIYVDADAAGADDGSSWTDAYTDLQSAFSAAGSGDEIWVAEGTYKPTSGTDRSVSFALVDGVALYGGFAGTESLRDERDWVAHETILSGDIGVLDDASDNSYHVVVGASNATLDGFTVTRGNANGGGFPDYYGGGMYTASVANLTVKNCAFSGNSASDGGGMLNYNLSSPALTGCVFSDNTASLCGGGMFNDGSSPTITNCTFSGNTASANSGGGMYNCYSSSPTVTNCTLSGNTAGICGGGMCNYDSSPTVSGCTFSGNSAISGGGMLNWVGSSPTVTNCAFSGNMATSHGGGMDNLDSSSPPVMNCTFSGNTATSKGGGIYNRSSSPTVTNCTFSINSAGAGGGGMMNYDNSFPVVTNCIFWGNAASDGEEIYDDADSVTVVTYSCVGQDGYTGADGNINADPLFVDADGADDIPGTLDDDLHLQAGSPCIDAADGDAAPETDIEGTPRLDDIWSRNKGVGDPPYADMGAYEFIPEERRDGGGCGSVPALALAMLAALLRRRKR